MPQLRQLRQRITLRCRTSALSLEETYGYIAERLRIAGANGEPIFSKEAIQAIHQYSRGIPRVVNLLCEHSMINAYVDTLRPVPAHLVEEVAREFQLDEVPPISGNGSSSVAAQQSVNAQALLESLNELLGLALFEYHAVPQKEIMSRIHEAIKKAQQERGTSAPAAPEIPSAPDASIPTTPEWRIAPPVGNAASALHPEPVAVLPSGYLRFEDIRANCAHPIWRPDANVNVFVGPGLSANGAEQFRTLRSRLYQIRAVRPLRTLLVTSSVPGEGKTFVTSNLAQSIVRQSDRSVLIIDADLRCARVHTHLGAPSSPGLTDYLRGEADEMAVIQHGQEGNLCLIAGGSEVTNPSELLLNGRFKKLLDNVAPVFDWVIIDSPPCLPVADATILADSLRWSHNGRPSRNYTQCSGPKGLPGNAG